MTRGVLVIYYWTTPPCTPLKGGIVLSVFGETGSAFAKATARQARGNSLFASGETSKGNKK